VLDIEATLETASMSTQPFLLNPKNHRVLEGRPRGGTGDVLLILFMVPFVLAGIAMTLATAREIYLWTAFSQFGVDARGVVTRLWVEGAGEDQSFHVAYEYGLDPSDDRTNPGDDRIDETVFKHLEKGGPIAIRYLRTDPSSSTVSGHGGWMFLAFFTLFWDAVTVFLCRGVVKGALRNQRLREGCHVPGEVIDATSKDDSDGNLLLTIDYRFQSPDGRQLTGTASRIRNDLKENALPQRGAALVVQYAEGGDNEPL
jgi:hypothetical protein